MNPIWRLLCSVKPFAFYVACLALLLSVCVLCWCFLAWFSPCSAYGCFELRYFEPDDLLWSGLCSFLVFLAIHCTPALCLLLFVLLSSAFWLYLLYFRYSCLLVLFVLLYRLGFLQFLKLEADIPFSVHTVHAPVMTCRVSFIQFLKLLQMPTILRFLLSCACRQLCLRCPCTCSAA